MKIMKILSLAACIFCAAFAYGQAAGTNVISSQPQVHWAASHTEHAYGKPLASQQSLLSNGGYSSARGERPLWEVAPPRRETPLGDTARDLKKEHSTARRSKVLVEN